MPLARRPSPLSDEVCASGPAPVLLGATNNGIPLPVKNTFVDVPSGLTPASLKNWREPMMTAPAGLSKKMGCFQALPETAPSPGMMIGETPPVTPQSTNGFHYAVTTPTSSVHGSYAGVIHPGGAVYTPMPYTPGPFTSAPTTPGSAGATGASVVTTMAPALQEQIPMWTSTKVAWEQVTDEAGEAENEGDSDDDSEEFNENATPLQLRNPEDAPKPPPGALHPSIGSEGHAMGCCKRCCFFPRGRCANGYECEFCHYEHDKRKRKNKKKRTIRSSASAHLSFRARQGLGNGTTRLLLAKELMRSSVGSRMEPIGSRQVITVPAAAMERRPGAPMPNGTYMAQAPLFVQNGGAAFQQQLGGQAHLAAWLAAAPSQQFVGYCQATGIQGQHQQQQQVLVYGNTAGGQQLSTGQVYGTTAAPNHVVGTAAACPCPFGPADSLQVLVHNPQQPASHMIMLPPAMSQAAAQGPPTLPPQRYCEPPPPPMGSPRLQRILGLPPPAGAMLAQR